MSRVAERAFLAPFLELPAAKGHSGGGVLDEGLGARPLWRPTIFSTGTTEENEFPTNDIKNQTLPIRTRVGKKIPGQHRTDRK
jgi:hypothetical protein